MYDYKKKKKNITTHQQGKLGGMSTTFMHKFEWWNFVYFITKP